MFSNIDEVWNNDPIKEINKKFKHNQDVTPYDSKNTNDFWSAKRNSQSYDPISLSSDNFNSEMNSEMNSEYAPIDFSNYDKCKKKSLDLNHDNKCSFSIKHLSKCWDCKNKLKIIVDKKIKSRMDEIILNNKMDDLKKMYVSSPPTPNNTNIITDNYKELIVLFIGIFFAFIIFCMMVKLF